MNKPYRPAGGLTAGPSPINNKTEIVRIEYMVFTQANCVMAWKIFSDWKLWPSFSDIYGNSMEWRGTPWAPGSRLLIDIVQPIAAKVDRVITVCTPPRCVAWINHVHGYTMEQWVLLDPYTGGGTKITTWIELTGAELWVDGRDVRVLVKGLLEQWFRNFCAECDRAAAGY
jgi:hypothetical protein